MTGSDVAAKALSGAVIVDEERKRGLLINSIEVYGRDRINESHYEQHSLPSRRLSSVPPPHNTQYRDVLIKSFQQADRKRTVTKLIIGTRSFSVLVTSSIRIDVPSIEQPECGPNTNEFMLNDVSSASSRLYVNTACWEDAMKIANDSNCHTIESFDILAQLRQIRTKFHVLSTYEPSRGSLLNEPLCRPYTIFTYRLHGQGTMNDGKVASPILAEMVIQVLRNKQDATLKRNAVEDIAKDAKKESRVGAVLEAIVELFGDTPEINIIANEELNKHAESLAAILSSYLTKGNKSVIDPAILDCLKTY